MTAAVAQILEETEQLSPPERAELADCIIERMAHEVPAGITAAQLGEVRARIAQVEDGRVALVPGEEALEHIWRLITSARRPD
jgi:putative addiction module component (TIGR02574 family)